MAGLKKVESRRSARALVAPLAAVAILGTAGFVFWPAQRRASESATAAQAPANAHSFRFDWPRGRSYTYAVGWESTEHVVAETASTSSAGGPAAGGVTLEGKVEIRAKLLLRSFGMVDGDYLLGASLSDFERHSFKINDSDALGDDASVQANFVGHEAFARVAPTGELLSVAFPGASDQSPPVFEHVLQTLLTELEVVVPTGASVAKDSSWGGAEQTSFGRAYVRYGATDVSAWSRTRARYEKLDGVEAADVHVDSNGVVQVAAAGHVESLRQSDTVNAKSGSAKSILDAAFHLEAKLERMGAFDASLPPDMGGLVALRPGQLRSRDTTRTNLLEQQVAGLTPVEMLGTVIGATGEFQGKSRFLWRASGLLQLHPETASELARLGTANGTKKEQRALALDLLASASTKEAQAAMREILASDAARADRKAYGMLVQRFSFVQDPDRDSGNFLGELYRDSVRAGDSDSAYAAAYSLGAVAFHLANHDDTDGANEIADSLRQSVGQARSSSERANLITALGSAGRLSDLPTFSGYAGDEDAYVRKAVASAAYKIDSNEVRALILDLVDDPAPMVQAAALRSLNQRSLTTDDLAALAAIVVRGVVHRSNFGGLIELLSTRTDGGGDVAQILMFIVRESLDDSSMVTRAQQLLEQTMAASRMAAANSTNP